ncbi:MAG: TraB/GumN family protein [Planctomycetes bacterium]|nr:TraB/GumN family protein [Planctomycetota bacterium]
MEDNVVKLEYQGKEIILIPTAHVSKQSAELVRKVINEEKPESICIELDEGRYQNLQNPKAWKNTDVVQIIKSKKVGFLLANIVLGSFQKKIANQLGTVVGQEMLQGIDSAKETGVELVLADRDIQVTFLRIWRKLGFWGKCKLFFSLLFSFGEEIEISSKDVNDLLKEETLESVISEMRKKFPVIGEVLISERDQYLAHKIKKARGEKVVAILGGAHVPGVKEEIFKSQDISKITEVPRGSPIFKIIGWAIPVIIVGLFIYGFALNIQTGLQQISVWVIWNSGLAALFTALVLGHPLSILTALVVAPFTSMNPFLACGWLAGLVEATIRKPTVQDINNISQDIFSFKRFFRNRFLKVLAVVIMANIGSSIGTFIAGTNIIKNLF